MQILGDIAPFSNTRMLISNAAAAKISSCGLSVLTQVCLIKQLDSGKKKRERERGAIFNIVKGHFLDSHLCHVAGGV